MGRPEARGTLRVRRARKKLYTPQEYWSRWTEEEWNTWNMMPRDVRGKINDEIFSMWSRKQWLNKRITWLHTTPGTGATPKSRPLAPPPPTMAPPSPPRPPPGLPVPLPPCRDNDAPPDSDAALQDEYTFLMEASAKLMQRRAARAASGASRSAPSPSDNDARTKDVKDVVLAKGSSGSGGTGGSGSYMMQDDDDDAWGRWKTDAPWKADAPWHAGSGKGHARVAAKRQ